MFALLALFLSIILVTCAYGAWENMAKGWWVWLVPASASFLTYASMINS